MINFDEGNLAAGTLVTDQFEGLEISTPSEFGVMVFDTNNPTGGDYDLATEDLGNVLIVSEDGDSSDPDDDAAGGTIKIEFDEASTVTSIGLLDIEESGGFVEFFDAESNIIDGLEIEPFTNGRSFELYPVITSGISYIELNLLGSGALTSIDFSSGEPTVDASPILLTEFGWEQDGQQLGIWSDDGELVESSSAIEVAEEITVNTLGGNDVVDSLANSGIGLLNQGTIITGSGKDLLQVNVEGSGNNFISILNDIGAVIDTGEGEDRIISTIEAENNSRSHAGISLDVQSSIVTGEGNDTVTGIIRAGVDGNFDGNFHVGISTTILSEIATDKGDDKITGTVEVGRDGNGNTGFSNSLANTDTGAGDDLITGTVTVLGNGDRNTGFVNGEASTFTGDGDDQIIGTVEVGGNGSFNSGIAAGLGGINLEAGDDYLYGAVEVAGDGENNFGIENFNNFIRMGAGDDRIVGKGTDAYSGFNGTYDIVGLIDLGEGDDTIEGFGREVVEGGSGVDTAEFEFGLDDSVTFGSSDSTSIDITANEKTMSFTNVEEFMFAGESFTLDELIELV